MTSLETKHPRTPEPPRQRGSLLLTLAAYLLGAATAFLLLRDAAAWPAAASLAVLVAVGLCAVGAVWAYRTAARRSPPRDRPAAPPRAPRPAAVGQDLPTVTDYYENAADGVMTPPESHRWEPLPPEPDAAQPVLPPGGRQPALG